jgi:Tol biopolymer transport system component
LAIYDGQDGELIAEFPGTQGMRDAAISPDGLWLASTNSRGWIFQIWGIEARKVVSTTVLGGLFNTATFDLIRFSPDGQRVVVASRFQRWVNVYKFQSCHSPKSDPTSYLDQR